MNLRDLRRRTMAGGMLSLALTAPVVLTGPAGAVAAAPGSCTAAELPVPGGVPMSIVTAADPTGSVIFGRMYPDPGNSFDYPLLRWEDGRVTQFEMPGLDQEIASVNADGVGVGFGFIDDNTPNAYLYRDGAVTLLPGGNGALAHGINASGVIVGERDLHPLIWRSPTSAPEELPVPAGLGYGAVARTVDDDGTVVGNVLSKTKGSIPFVWAPDGAGRPLPPLGGDQRQFGVYVQALRNGWAIGGDEDFGTSLNDLGRRWNVRTGQVESVPDVFLSPSAVNASGWMVGSDPQGRGVLIADDQRLVLPDVFQHTPETFSNRPSTISDDGRVLAGQADDKKGTIHAVVWHCV